MTDGLGIGDNSTDSSPAGPAANELQKKEQEARLAKGYLRDFEIARPTLNNIRNSRTFAYRLSELVFGSLLAAYILGFLAFIAPYVQPFQGSQGDCFIVGINFGSFLHLSACNDLTKIAQYLVNSLIFSIYTALIYLIYHQSISYISTNYQESYSDFLTALWVGVFFGLSMLFPMMMLFFVGCLILVVLNKKRRLLKPYLNHFADKAHLVDDATDPQNKDDLDKARRHIMQALSQKSNPVLKSWSKVGGLGAWLAGGMLVVIPVIFLILTTIYPQLPGKFILPLANLAVSSAAAITAYTLLKRAVKRMPSRRHGGGDQLNEALNAALNQVQAAWKKQKAEGL